MADMHPHHDLAPLIHHRQLIAEAEAQRLNATLRRRARAQRLRRRADELERRASLSRWTFT